MSPVVSAGAAPVDCWFGGGRRARKLPRRLRSPFGYACLPLVLLPHRPRCGGLHGGCPVRLPVLPGWFPLAGAQDVRGSWRTPGPNPDGGTGAF